jgi:hypothetical protein
MGCVKGWNPQAGKRHRQDALERFRVISDHHPEERSAFGRSSCSIHKMASATV